MHVVALVSWFDVCQQHENNKNYALLCQVDAKIARIQREEAEAKARKKDLSSRVDAELKKLSAEQRPSVPGEVILPAMPGNFSAV